MNSLVLYFILANVGLIAFYLFFRLFLQRDTFFREKRVAIIVGILFALTYPMIDVSGWIERSDDAVLYAKNIRMKLPVVYIAREVEVPEAVVPVNSGKIVYGSAIGVTSAVTSRKKTIDWFSYVLVAYLLVAAWLLFRILRQIVLMIWWMRQNNRFQLNGQHFYTLPKGTAPFSFFKAIFLNPEAYTASDLDEIMHHEQAHCQQGHTYDVLFGELLCVVFWVNPFAWMLKRRMRENLEFLADNNVLNKGFDPKSYQYHLLQLSCQRSDANLANHFNVTQLKKRIVMMNKKRTSWTGLGKYALSLPLFASLLLTAYAWGQQNEQKVKNLIAEASAESMLVQEKFESNQLDLAQNVQPKPELSASENEMNQDSKCWIYSFSKNKTLVVYNDPETKALFPGGVNTFYDYFKENLKYPVDAIASGEQGLINVQFIVEEHGILLTFQVLNNNPGNELLSEFRRVWATAHKIRWKPAENEGKKVAYAFTIPFVFKFEGENPVDESTLTNSITIVTKRDTLVEQAYHKRRDGVFSAEVMPQFPGGKPALFSYIKETLRNPGTNSVDLIPVNFVVSETGVINQVLVYGSERYDPIYLAEAIRLVKEMPTWVPGESNGQKVAVKMTLPVLFNAQNDPTKKVSLVNAGSIPRLVVLDGKIVNLTTQTISPDSMSMDQWAALLNLEKNSISSTSVSQSSSPILVNADQAYAYGIISLQTNRTYHP